MLAYHHALAGETGLSGPAAKSPMMNMAYSKDDSRIRGTVKNCPNGYTP